LALHNCKIEDYLDEASEEINRLTVGIYISNKFFVAEDLLQLPGVGTA
jgi:hypothetical protein